MRFVHTGPALGLALSLLSPATAFAQAPPSPQAASASQVQMKVIFVTVGSADLAADLSKSGLRFDRVPFVPPVAAPQTETSLRYMAGDTAGRLFQMLARERSRSVQAPLVNTADGIPATVQINTQVPDRQEKFLTFQTRLLLTPRINTDDSITLFVGLQAGDVGADTLPEPQATTLRTVRSGDMLVVEGLPLAGNKTPSTGKLLVFIQPTLASTNAQRGNAGQPAPPSLPRQETSPATGRTAHIEVFNADLHKVIAMMERLYQLKASEQQSDSAYNPVNVHLNGASLSEALGAIARSAGAQIIQDEHGVYVFSPLPGAVTTTMPKAPVGDGSTVVVTP